MSGKFVEPSEPEKMNTRELSGTLLQIIQAFRNTFLETGHTIAWDGVKTLTYERDWKKRKIKEGIFIAKIRNDMLLNTRPRIPVADVYRVLR